MHIESQNHQKRIGPKGFTQVKKGTRAALNGYIQKELTKFDLELGYFISESGHIGFSRDKKRTRIEAWDDEKQQTVMDKIEGVKRKAYYYKD